MKINRKNLSFSFYLLGFPLLSYPLFLYIYIYIQYFCIHLPYISGFLFFFECFQEMFKLFYQIFVSKVQCHCFSHESLMSMNSKNIRSEIFQMKVAKCFFFVCFLEIECFTVLLKIWSTDVKYNFFPLTNSNN